MAQEQASGTYLYAVTSDRPRPEILGELAGVRGGKVYTIADRDLTAVVSDVPTREELRPERRNLAAHQQVLGKVVENTRVVLPVAFGTIADGPDGVRHLLTRYHDDLAGQLKRVEGHEQMNLRLAFGGPGSIFEYLIGEDDELRRLRDALIAAGDGATREQKIDVGQRFDTALSALRDRYAEQLEKELADVCADVRRLPPRSEQEIARLGCLVSREARQAWEQAVDRAAAALPGEFVLEPSGPLPPYDFVDLHLQA